MIWALAGPRTGDNSQVLALASAAAERLGATVERKTLAYNRLYSLPNALLGASLSSLTAEARQSIAPPWPDIVIGVGRRSVPVARHVARVSDRRVINVRIGRPRAPLSWFDLVVTTAQYGLPEAANVVMLDLPLTGKAFGDHGDGDVAGWRDAFTHLPRPWRGVLVGASAWPYRLDEAAAMRLADELNAAPGKPGSVLVTSSPRTRARVIDVLQARLTRPAFVHRFTREGANPYRAILALADDLVVTCDSISMTAEACRTGKPVALFRLERSPLALPLPVATTPFRRLASLGVLSPPRDAGRVHRRLVAAGRVSWFGEDLPAPAPRTGAGDDGMERTLARLEGLVKGN